MPRRDTKDIWLAPLHVPPALKERLMREHERLEKGLGGVKIPRAVFVRMLLEKALEVVEGTTWGGIGGVVIAPSVAGFTRPEDLTDRQRRRLQARVAPGTAKASKRPAARRAKTA